MAARQAQHQRALGYNSRDVRPKKKRIEASAETLQKGMTGVGRWLGAGTKDHEYALMQEQYRRRKAGIGHAKTDGKRFSAFGLATNRKKNILPGPTSIGFNQAGVSGADLLKQLMQDNSSSESSNGEDYEDMTIFGSSSSTTDLNEGLEHYRKLRTAENRKVIKPGWLGGVENKRRESVVDAGLAGRDKTRQPKKRHSNIRNDTMVALQLQAMPTYKPHFINYLTSLQVLIGIGLCAHAYTATDPVSGANQFAEIGITFTRTPCDISDTEVDGKGCGKDFLGDWDTEKFPYEEINWTVGPTLKYLIRAGARVPACIRTSAGKVSTNWAKERVRECTNTPNTVMNPIAGYQCSQLPEFAGLESPNPYACCQVSNGFGMTTYTECMAWRTKDCNPPSCPAGSRVSLDAYDHSYCSIGLPKKCKACTASGNIGEPVVPCSTPDAVIVTGESGSSECTTDEGICVGKLSNDPGGSDVVWEATRQCSEVDDKIVLRPCCGISDGSCELLTDTQCAKKGGNWDDFAMLCSDSMCLGSSCELRFDEFVVSTIDAASVEEGGYKNEPSSSGQWWRFILPLFIHSGIAWLFMILYLQHWAGKQIETHAGSLRTALIYFISGIGGYGVSGIFSPSSVTLGADPAAFGLLGVLVVELFQAWQIVPNAKTQLAKLLALIFVALGIGTLPYIDNWSHIGGFFFGIVSGIVFLPYITFGQWDARRKKILLLVCCPLLLGMILLALVTFCKSRCSVLRCIVSQYDRAGAFLSMVLAIHIV